MNFVEKVNKNDEYYDVAMALLRPGITRVRCKDKNKLAVKGNFAFLEIDVLCRGEKLSPSKILCEEKSCFLGILPFSNKHPRPSWASDNLRDNHYLKAECLNNNMELNIVCKGGKFFQLFGGILRPFDNNCDLLFKTGQGELGGKFK